MGRPGAGDAARSSQGAHRERRWASATLRTRALHLSNLFFRDLHFAVMEFLKKKQVTVGQTEAETVAREVALHFEKRNILKKLNMRTWMLNYPDYSLKKST